MLGKSDLLSRALAFVLAGGQGKRLYPLTRDRAKPVVPFGGVHRLIDFTLSNCLNSGLRNIRILTQHHCESLHSYVRTLTQDDNQSLSCHCPAVGKRYRGTADAVFQNLPIAENAKADYVVILSGDHVYKMDYRDLLRFHIDRGAEMTIGAVEYPRHAASHFGVLQIDSQGYATGFEEKPKNPKPMFRKSTQALVSMGIYVFNTQALVDAVSDDAQRNSSHDFGHDIIPRFIHNRRLSVFNFTETGTRLGSYWRDVGTLDAYYSANMELLLTSFLDGGAAWPIWGSGAQYPSVPRTVTDAAEIVDSIVPEDAWVAPGSRVIHSVLSPGARIESTAAVQNSILLPNVHVGAGARVHRAILDDGVRVAEGAIVGFDRDCDRPYDFVTDNGIVAIPAHTYVENLQSSTSPHLQWKHFVSEDPFKTRQVR